MAHFAEINSDNIVVRVLVVGNDQEDRGQEFLANDLGLGGIWIKTSYNTRGGIHINGGIPLRKNYAGIGFSYDPQRDAFIPPKPSQHPSWILNEDSCLWEPPVSYPTNGKRYTWNESIVNWTPHPENPSGPYAWSELTYSWVFKPQDGFDYKWNRETYSWDKI